MTARHAIVSTRFGWILIGSSKKGLTSLTLSGPSADAALANLEGSAEVALEDDSAFNDLPRRLRRYFEGEVVSFPDRLDLDGGTTFQQAVWNATRTIPYGEVRTYAWVAKRIGRPQACRAVGNALARNRLPIIVPCHRVVASDGSLGGFGGGLGLKRNLLDLEAGRLCARVKSRGDGVCDTARAQ